MPYKVPSLDPPHSKSSVKHAVHSVRSIFNLMIQLNTVKTDFLANRDCLKRQSKQSLFSLTCSLARIDQAEIEGRDDKSLCTIEWPVEKLSKTCKIIVPPPCTDSPTESSTSIRCFLDQIPERMRAVSRKANPEKLVDLMLPESVISSEARIVGAAFWLWLCITDDILEDMSDENFVNGIVDLHTTLSGRGTPINSISDICIVTRTLLTTLAESKLSSGSDWRSDFVDCLLEIALAFKLERPLLQAKERIGLQEWMSLRIITISARPFMVLARASLNLPTALSPNGNPYHAEYAPHRGHDDKLMEPTDEFARLETTMQCIMGLQNDILGFEKDNFKQHYLNAVQILILQGSQEEAALDAGIEIHNYLSACAVQQGNNLRQKFKGIYNSKLPRAISSNNSMPSFSQRLNGTNSDAQSSSIHSSMSRHTSIEIEEISTPIEGPSTVFTPQTPCLLRSVLSKIKSHEQQPALNFKELVLTSSFEGNQWAQYVSVLLGFGNAMANWHVKSRRYVVHA